MDHPRRPANRTLKTLQHPLHAPLGMTLALATALCCSLSTHVSANILSNPGFETGSMSPWLGNAVNATDQPRTGSRCAKISKTSTGWWNITQKVAVQSNTAYDVAMWVKTQNVTNKITFVADLYNGDGDVVCTHWDNTQPGGTTPYQKLSLDNQVFVPPYITHLQIRAFFYYCTGTAWFDDAEITATEVESNPPWITITSLTQGQTIPTNTPITLACDAYDEDGIAHVQWFYCPVGHHDKWTSKDYSAPWSVTVTDVEPGERWFTAVLTDTTGRKCVSDIMWVTVSGNGSGPSIAVSRDNIPVSCEQGQDAANETFEVWNSGGGTLDYDVLESSSRLDVSPTNGTSTGPTDKNTHTITFNTSGLATGVYDRTITIEDDAAANSPFEIDVQITVTEPPVTIGTNDPFVAYNDLHWLAGEPTQNITLYTREESGRLVDYTTGSNTPVFLTITGGNGPWDDQGAPPNPGTDGHTLFAGKVGLSGLVSYAATDLELSFSGLNPALRYEVAVFGNRDEAAYVDRTSIVTLQGVEPGFSNTSSDGTTNSTTTLTDDTTTVGNGYNTPYGRVVSYTQINPGADGQMKVSLSDENTRFYANALMLKTCTAGTETEIKVSKGAVWRYRKGSEEASTPATDWRQPGFDLGSWATSNAPFGYGPLSYNTVLDMQNNYASVFLRKSFLLDRPGTVTGLSLDVDYDDGFILWLNGEETARVNVSDAPGTFMPHDHTCTGYVSGSSATFTTNLSGGTLPVLASNNVLAVQLFNAALVSGDAMLDLELAVTCRALAGADDADADGVPDAWETNEYGTAGTWGWADDPDLDGVSNIDEYIAGTGATNPESFFDVALNTEGTDLIVSFDALAVSGSAYTGLERRYALESRTSLDPNAVWAAVPPYTDILGQGQTVHYTNSTPGAKLLYRGRAWLAPAP